MGKYLFVVSMFLLAAGCSYVGPVDRTPLEVDTNVIYNASMPAEFFEKGTYCGLYYDKQFDKNYRSKYYTIKGTSVAASTDTLTVTKALGLMLKDGSYSAARTWYSYSVVVEKKDSYCDITIIPENGFSENYQFKDGLVRAPKMAQMEANALISSPKIDLKFDFITEKKPDDIFKNFGRHLEKFNLSDYYYYHDKADEEDMVHYFVHKRDYDRGIVMVKVKWEKRASLVKIKIDGYKFDMNTEFSDQIDALVEMFINIINTY